MYDEMAELLVDNLGVPAGEIRPEVTFEDLGLDSLALVEFTMMLKKQLGVVLGDDVLRGRTTVAEAVELAESKVVRV